MRILKSGIVEIREKYWTCAVCKAEFTYTPSDVQADRDGAYINCPCCKAFIVV